MDDEGFIKNTRVNFYPGDFVKIKRKEQQLFLINGFDSFPGEYGFHGAIRISPNSIGIILEVKELFCHILFNDRRCAWLEYTQIENIHK